MCLLQVDWLKRGPGWVRYFEITILTDQDSSGCCGLRILTAEDQPATSDNVTSSIGEKVTNTCIDRAGGQITSPISRGA